MFISCDLLLFQVVEFIDEEFWDLFEYYVVLNSCFYEYEVCREYLVDVRVRVIMLQNVEFMVWGYSLGL